MKPVEDTPPLRTLLSRWSSAAVWGPVLPRRCRVSSQRLSVSDDFMAYLLSDDTRLPQGLVAPPKADDPDDYDGEVLFEEDTAASPGGPSFPDEVRRVRDAFAAVCPGRRVEADYGVVVAGAYGTLNDAPWATLNGGVRCIDARDVFATLRASCKLHRDLRWQQRSGERPALWLRRYHDWHGSSEYRVVVEAGAVAAVCQRGVDQVFHELADLDAAALEALATKLAAVAEDVVAAVRADPPPADASAAQWAAAPSLLVDVAHEGGSLPVVVVGVTAVRALTDCGDAEAHKRADEARAAAEAAGEGSEEAFPLGDTHPLAFRVLRSLEMLREFTAGPAAKQVAVAREQEDLCGDGQKLGGGGQGTMPLELQHPELFEADEAMKAFLQRVADEQRRAGGEFE